MAKPYKSLGFYKWKKGRRYAKLIGKDLVKLTSSLGYKGFKNPDIQRNARPAWNSDKHHAEVRMTAVAGSQAEDWHQDGDTTVPEDMDFGLIVWASRDPTEIRVNGVVYQPKPYEVVYVNNLDCHHRRPPNIQGGKRRWHFRQRVERR